MKMEIQPVDPEFVRVWSRVKSAPAAAPPILNPSEPARGGVGGVSHRQDPLRTPARTGLPAAGVGSPRPGERRAGQKAGRRLVFLLRERFPLHPQGKPGRYPNLGEAIRQLYQGEGYSEEDYRRAAQLCRGGGTAAGVHRLCPACQATRQALWETVERTWR